MRFGNQCFTSSQSRKMWIPQVSTLLISISFMLDQVNECSFLRMKVVTWKLAPVPIIYPSEQWSFLRSEAFKFRTTVLMAFFLIWVKVTYTLPKQSSSNGSSVIVSVSDLFPIIPTSMAPTLKNSACLPFEHLSKSGVRFTLDYVRMFVRKFS